MKKLASYFFQGLAIVLPLLLTVAAIYWLVRKVDALIPTGIPGLGLLIVLVALPAIGFIFSNVVGRTLLAWLDTVLMSTPLIKILYTSIKDLIDAFVGEKRKFTEAVVVQLLPGELHMMGFITRHDLAALGQEGMVSVYLPNAYAVSGMTILISATRVIPANIGGAEAMKFLMSGGVTGIDLDGQA